MKKLIFAVLLICFVVPCYANGRQPAWDQDQNMREAFKNATALFYQAKSLVIGDTFALESKILKEKRRINIYLPPGYTEQGRPPLPVLYMPDGGLAEDFLHVAGLVQVSVGNGTMRPFLLIGIENTQRRRDLTGPTENEDDKKIATRVGGSAAFRRFLRDELMPQVKSRYRTTNETAIVGESLAGLFVLETFFLEPALFDTYIAFDPSLWWNDEKLIKTAAEQMRSRPSLEKTLYLASSSEPGISATSERLADILRKNASPLTHWHYEKMPEEKHSTIYHPAALKAFRTVFAPKSTHADSGELFTLGTLYQRHKTVAAYDLNVLRETILAIKPDVLVLDVTPSELQQQKVFPNKIEYPEVIFPLVRSGKYRVYAAEPPEPMFSELVQPLSQTFESMREKRPEDAAILNRYTDNVYEALKATWHSPADVNSAVTDKVLAGLKTFRAKLLGPVDENTERKWNGHTVSVALRAMKENPGQRVLVLVGIDNCYMIRGELSRNSIANLVDIEQWLRANASTAK